MESHFILPGLKVPYVRTLVENSQKFTKIVSRILRNDSFDIVMLVFCTAQISQHANQPEKPQRNDQNVMISMEIFTSGHHRH